MDVLAEKSRDKIMDIGSQKMLQHVPHLRRYARALIGDVEQGDALTKTTMECAASLQKFMPKDISPSVWLFSVMHNLTTEFLNDIYDNVNSQSILPYMHAEDLNVDKEAPNFGIKGAMAHLTLQQKETLLLTTVEKLSYIDVCQVMAFDQAALINSLDSARKTMCNFLFQDQFEDLQQA
ncbi:MAG: hypothetical protein ACC707_14345 [Thiohalomonadales bacterium]